MKKRLYLVRHGQTMFNRQHRIQGWCDSPLTEVGKRQAKAVKEYFEEHGISFDHAYCSTSERCGDTLELITDMPYTRTKELKEMFYGELEAESERLGTRDPRECETYYLRFGGESSNAVRDRMISALREIMERNDHHSVLAVSHGGASFNFLRGIGADMRTYADGITNCCVFVLEYEDGKFHLTDCIPNPVKG
ncbi:MAG: histidine phosphatase family protein [Hungatella sp.]|jgi:broad specificity phosphatase PhoE|nr:histidine phosphatase family protein [Hungatella sp.]MCI9636896.1 histidine phosphatase family protein [Hungatella sp.]